jgi:hypothetical protein
VTSAVVDLDPTSQPRPSGGHPSGKGCSRDPTVRHIASVPFDRQSTGLRMARPVRRLRQPREPERRGKARRQMQRGRAVRPGLRIGSASRTRTCDPAVNSRLLYRLSYRGSGSDAYITGSDGCNPFSATYLIGRRLLFAATLCYGARAALAACPVGLVAERLCKGLQIPLVRFDSGRGLQNLL